MLRRLLRDIFRAAGGTHDDWDTYDRVMAEERRAAVLIAPRRAYPPPHLLKPARVPSGLVGGDESGELGRQVTTG